MNINFRIATHEDAARIADLRNAAADALSAQFGEGHWSGKVSEDNVRLGITNTSQIIMALAGDKLVGCLRLAQKKPWAIDANYFTPVKRALYLLDMAVAPDLQRNGIGSQLMREAGVRALSWPADAIRLNAYDAAAGAGEFYRRCGLEERGGVVYRNVPLIYFEKILDLAVR